MSSTVSQDKGDEDLLTRSGYIQELSRKLGWFSMFALAFSIISLTTGIYTNLNFGLSTFGPAMIWLWPVAAVGQLIFGLVLAELASRMPFAGYSFQWGGRLIGPRFGWFVAWNLILTLGFASGAETLFLLSPMIATVLGLDASNQTLITIISILIMVACAFVTIYGVGLTAILNNWSVPTEILGTLVVALIILVLILFRPHPLHDFSFLFNTGDIPKGTPVILAAATALLVGVFTIGGFEGASDLGEETVGVQRAVARGIIWAVALSGVFGFVTLIGLVLGIPDIKAVEASPTPVVVIVNYWFGPVLTKIFLVTVIYSVFALMVVQVAMVGRLIFSLSRDNVFPASKFFSAVHHTRRTPIASLVLTTVFYIAVIVFAVVQPSAYGRLIGGGIIEFNLAYWCLLVAYAWKRNTIPVSPAFDLGRWAMLVIGVSFVWLSFLLTLFITSKDFRDGAITAGELEVVGLVIIFTYVTWAVRRGGGAALSSGRVAPAAAEAKPGG